MGRLANPVKAQEWRRRLRRFEASDLTVARFCSRERVTVSAFWYWRRKCAEVGGPSEQSEAAFAPVDVIGGRSVPLRFPSGAVLEIPDDCPTLVRLAIETLAGASEPC